MQRISKGDSIFIPIQTVNRSKQLWGPDAEEFRCVNHALSFSQAGLVTDVLQT